MLHKLDANVILRSIAIYHKGLSAQRTVNQVTNTTNRSVNKWTILVLGTVIHFHLFQVHPFPSHIPDPEWNLRHVWGAAMGRADPGQVAAGKYLRAALWGNHPKRRSGAYSGSLFCVSTVCYLKE